MRSNINRTILKLIDDEDISQNEKEFLLKALELEYDHSNMKRPRLEEQYKSFVEEFSGNYED